MSLGVYAIWWVVAFLCGSVPFAVLLGRLNGVDVRQVGSGNPGATNLGRAAGRKWGVACFVLDVLKGLLPVLAYGFVLLGMSAGFALSGRGEDPTAGVAWVLRWVGLAIAAVLGHVFSPWLGFRGGKGVATGLGAALGLFPFVTLPAVLCGIVWLVLAKTTGYVGLSSVIAAALLPVLTVPNAVMIGLDLNEAVVFGVVTALLAAVVIWRHRGNLQRLRAGTEPKAKWTGKAGENAEMPETQQTQEGSQH